MRLKISLLTMLWFCWFSMAAIADEVEVRPAPGCPLSNIENTEQYDIQKFKGQVVYVDFWASWCGPCIQSFPYMNALHRDLQNKGLAVLGINVDENREDAKTFVQKLSPSFQIAADANGKCAEDFGVKAMPTTFLVDRKGMMRAVHYGFKNGETEEFRETIEQLLAEPVQ